MSCRICQQPITSLNSQKNGVLDVCQPCAIAAAPFLHYKLMRKRDVIHEEIICQSHYRIESQPWHSMGPLADRETGVGYVQTVTPYTGGIACATCEEEADDE